MKVHVRCGGQLKRALGWAERSVELPPHATVASLLESIATSVPPDAARFLLDVHDARPAALLVSRNGEQVALGADPVLADGDQITFLPPISGGTGELPPLSDAERAFYEWQIDVAGLGETGQRKLKAATVLVSRVGGIGGVAALELAAAGVGRIVLAHAGNARISDLHRQVLLDHSAVGKPRVETFAARLLALNPHIQVLAIGENITAANAERLVALADVVLDAAPRFEERLELNRACVKLQRPIVECAMYELEATLTTILPGTTPCLGCLVPSPPAAWSRRFPVLGAVSGAVGSLGATEVVKLITGIGEPLLGRMLRLDLAAMRFETIALKRDPACAICGTKRRTIRQD